MRHGASIGSPHFSSHWATLVADFGMNPPDTVWRNPGFWTALGAGVLLGFLVHALFASRRKKDS